jgi:Pentapeptide repeats (9 copies)
MPPSEAVCGVEMQGRRLCGRAVVASGHDERPVCLMHSKDPNKDATAFDAVVEQTLATGGPCDFTGFVFSGPAAFDGRAFVAEVFFWRATFSAATSFGDATFAADAWFSHATFAKDATFYRAKFSRDARFVDATFASATSFFAAKFAKEANFYGAKFTEDASFDNARFSGEARFVDAAFTGKAGVSHATFAGKADFSRAKFGQNANFNRAAFSGEANFYRTAFSGEARFSAAEFAQNASFDEVTFVGIADFRRTRFLATPGGSLRVVNRRDGDPGLRVRMADCDITRVRLVDINWHIADGRLTLQDELDVRGADGRQELVAAAYRQLVSNFEDARAYELAEQADVGAMEMRRLDPRRFILGYRPKASAWVRRTQRWIGERLSMTNLYRVVSRYGTDYWRALKVLVLLILLMGFGYTLPTVQLAPCPVPVTIWNYGERLNAGLVHTLQVASFQRARRYRTESATGAWLETTSALLLPAQAAMFLFALRRRFRR